MHRLPAGVHIDKIECRMDLVETRNKLIKPNLVFNDAGVLQGLTQTWKVANYIGINLRWGRSFDCEVRLQGIVQILRSDLSACKASLNEEIVELESRVLISSWSYIGIPRMMKGSLFWCQNLQVARCHQRQP